MERFGSADFLEQPWKNGGGLTREQRRAPHPRNPQGFAWRISTATVATSGPFSVFPGVDRTLLLLAGNGLALRCGDAPEQELRTPGQTIYFSGDLATHCRLLDGPIQDFNLMVDRTLHRGEVAFIKPGDAVPASAPTSLVYVLQGELTLSILGSDKSLQLARGELGHLTNASAVCFRSTPTGFSAVKADIYPK